AQYREQEVIPGHTAAAADEVILPGATGGPAQGLLARRVQQEDDRHRTTDVDGALDHRRPRPGERGVDVKQGQGDGESSDEPTPPAQIRTEPAGGVVLAEDLLRLVVSDLLARLRRCGLCGHGRSTPCSS